jgi:ArsR family transcriptional regulator
MGIRRAQRETARAGFVDEPLIVVIRQVAPVNYFHISRILELWNLSTEICAFELGLDPGRRTGYRQLTITMHTKTSKDEVCCPAEQERREVGMMAIEGPEADDELAKLSKALGHPARVRILRLLSRKEARVCSQIVDELPLAQSTVSEHLRILKEAGLVRSSQDGPRVGYCINFDGLRRLKALVAII